MTTSAPYSSLTGPAASPPGAAPVAEPSARLAEREALYNQLQPLRSRLLRQYGAGEREVGEDLSGQLYCDFCRLYAAYDPERGIPLVPYLIRSLTMCAYTFNRRYWRQSRRETGLESAEIEGCLAGADPAPEWDRQLLTASVLEALPALIACLPPRQRQVVIWRYYEARSFEEIAAVLDIRPASVRSLLRHGLNNLRGKLSAWE